MQHKYLRQSHHPAGDVSEVTLSAALFEAVDPVGDVGELAQLTALHEAVDPAGEDGSQSTDVSTRVSNRVNDEIVGAKFRFSRKLKNRVISCEILKSTTKVVDFEKDVYANFAQKFDWKQVDESLVKQ